MSIATSDMRHGMKVSLENSGEWEVLDRTPRNRTWWLHRWNNGKWETTDAHEDYMDAVSELSEAVTERATWGRAPFNTSSNRNGSIRRVGYALGKWGTHKNSNGYGWTVTHLPTGLSVPTDRILGYRATITEVRAVVEMLAAEDFPLLDGLEFGSKPVEVVRPEIERLKALLTPVLQDA
jgi:hypothetical protein